jgi:hypothetical protein
MDCFFNPWAAVAPCARTTPPYPTMPHPLTLHPIPERTHPIIAQVAFMVEPLAEAQKSTPRATRPTPRARPGPLCLLKGVASTPPLTSRRIPNLGFESISSYCLHPAPGAAVTA